MALLLHLCVCICRCMLRAVMPLGITSCMSWALPNAMRAMPVHTPASLLSCNRAALLMSLHMLDT